VFQSQVVSLSTLVCPCISLTMFAEEGYPRGSKGTQIPLEACLFAIIDVWDALTSDRPYRPAWSETRAKDFIRSQSGAHFDPEVVDKFLNSGLI
jgi:HD-GYP domain-containing protein (c-di-GMP phosphodiesterase class II)